MRRILTDDVATYAEEYADCITSGKKNGLAQWNKMPIDRLAELRNWLKQKKEYRLARYVRKIELHFREIVLLIPDDFGLYHSRNFELVWNEGDLNKKLAFHKEEKPFWELVVWALNYEGVRDTVFPYFIRKMKIQSCVYCNSQYAVTTEKDKDGNSWAMYQLDHFKPKSKFPYLAVSFYNLQPCCANCNQHKYNKDALFNLYTNMPSELEPFHFVFTPDDMIKFIVSGDDAVLVKLDSHDTKLLANHQELFLVDMVYGQHIDIAKETLVRLYMNDVYYRKQLHESLVELFPNGVESPERFFWGNYMNKKEIHRRPMSKYMQDVVDFAWKKH